MSEQHATVTTVRMFPDTVEDVEDLKNSMKSPSFSETIRRTIGISKLLINEISKGSRVIIEDKAGRQQEIFIIGVNR